MGGPHQGSPLVADMGHQGLGEAEVGETRVEVDPLLVRQLAVLIELVAAPLEGDQLIGAHPLVEGEGADRGLEVDEPQGVFPGVQFFPHVIGKPFGVLPGLLDLEQLALAARAHLPVTLFQLFDWKVVEADPALGDELVDGMLLAADSAREVKLGDMGRNIGQRPPALFVAVPRVFLIPPVFALEAICVDLPLYLLHPALYALDEFGCLAFDQGHQFRDLGVDVHQGHDAVLQQTIMLRGTQGVDEIGPDPFLFGINFIRILFYLAEPAGQPLDLCTLGLVGKEQERVDLEIGICLLQDHGLEDYVLVILFHLGFVLWVRAVGGLGFDFDQVQNIAFFLQDVDEDQFVVMIYARFIYGDVLLLQEVGGLLDCLLQAVPPPDLDAPGLEQRGQLADRVAPLGQERHILVFLEVGRIFQFLVIELGRAVHGHHEVAFGYVFFYFH